MLDCFEPFESPLLLISSAKENLTKLEIACKVFVTDCKYTPFLGFDSKADEGILKIRLNDRFPGQIRVLGSSIINDLRHALDQAVCDGAIMLGAPNAKNTYFPFAKDPADFRVKLKDKCRKVRPDLVDFIQKFKPYLGGDDLLWALNRIAGKNKHERIFAISTKNTFHADNINSTGLCKLNFTRWNDRKNELEIARLGDGGKAEFKGNLTLEVVIGSADVVGGQPAIEVLNAFLGKAESIVLGIKAESERLLRV
ncbi:MAG: hypothetical protein ACOY9D_01775 [Pseudomonadota bacterium]